MSAFLDLDDVCAGNPKAKEELEALRAALETRIPELEKRLEGYEALAAENAKLRGVIEQIRIAVDRHQRNADAACTNCCCRSIERILTANEALREG